MTLETLFALTIFALVSSITPGPNNFMLLASGVNFGFRQTIPHMFGIAGGFGLLILCIGTGLGALITAFPTLHTALKFLGAGYLLYLAFRIAMSRSMGAAEDKGRPMTFLEAAAFQWVNPKAWTMALTAVAVYTDPAVPFLSLMFVAGAFVLVNFPSISVWTAFGTMFRRFLADPVRLKYFNITMGVLLALTVIPMIR